MPKLILRCNYLKNAPPSQLSNYIHYIGTREGVEKVSPTLSKFPATEKQKELIEGILQSLPDSCKMHEYYDYPQNPTRENASDFITQALENNLDLIAKKKNYMDYLANRPGAEKTGTHGLFSDEGEAVVLSSVMDEVSGHKGIIWTNVISLRREDAERLGYDSASQWQALLRSRTALLCEQYGIDRRNLKWYAAFHNESHHPHVHLVVYSLNASEGHLTKKGIEAMRSTYAHDIFRQDFMNLYEQKTTYREQVKEQAEESLLFLLGKMQNGLYHNRNITEKMQLLSKRLMNTGGKKVYGYLKADVKAIINDIVNELAKDEKVAACYQKWIESKYDILRYYKDTMPEQPPLSEQKELKSIKNMVIREAMRLGQGALFYEEILEGPKWEAEEPEPGEADLPVDDETEQSGTAPQGHEEADQAFAQISGFAAWIKSYKKSREYLYGTKETKPDAQKAYALMRAEAASGNAYAMHDMGKIYAQGILVEKDTNIAEEWYHKALQVMLLAESREKIPYLEYRIGKMYQYGLGTETDLEKAAFWFTKAAGKGHQYAQYTLGMLYLKGMGVEKNEETAFYLLEQSYKKGNAYAAYQVGKMYRDGVGTQEDTGRAEKCFISALSGFLSLEKDRADDNLWNRIGCMYLDGLGTESDEEKGELFLLKAEQYGNKNAMYRLARLYLNQEEEKKQASAHYRTDEEKVGKAITWLKNLAEEHNSYAAYRLGRLYLARELVAKDVELAVRFLEASAEADNPDAQYALGKLYYAGKDVPEDKEKAYAYFLKASEQGNEYATFFIEHWDELTKPDMFFMTTRLIRALARVMEDDVKEKRRGGAGMTDRKLHRKIKAKKTAQGHAKDDRESPVLSQ